MSKAITSNTAPNQPGRFTASASASGAANAVNGNIKATPKAKNSAKWIRLFIIALLFKKLLVYGRQPTKELNENPFTLNVIPTHSITKQPTIILQLHEAIQPSTFQTIIDETAALFAAGHTHIVIDLSTLPHLNLTTAFTLYSIAAIANKESPADPEDGWYALHEMAHNLSGKKMTNMHLCAPQPKVARALAQNGFTDSVQILPNPVVLLNAPKPLSAFGIYS